MEVKNPNYRILHNKRTPPNKPPPLFFCVIANFIELKEKSEVFGEIDTKVMNKYRGGTLDATTSSSLIVPLFTMSVDDFSPSKTAIFGVRK